MHRLLLTGVGLVLVLYLLPVLGVIIAGLYRVTKVEGKDTNAVIESVHFGKNVPVLLVPVIFVSTVLPPATCPAPPDTRRYVP